MPGIPCRLPAVFVLPCRISRRRIAGAGASAGKITVVFCIINYAPDVVNVAFAGCAATRFRKTGKKEMRENAAAGKKNDGIMVAIQKKNYIFVHN